MPSTQTGQMLRNTPAFQEDGQKGQNSQRAANACFHSSCPVAGTEGSILMDTGREKGLTAKGDDNSQDQDKTCRYQ